MSHVLRSGTGVLALACGFVVLAGCSSASTSSQGQAPTASASSGLAIPGTHRETKTYQIPAPGSTAILMSHAGIVSSTGGTAPGVSVPERLTYPKTPPATSRTVSDRKLT